MNQICTTKEQSSRLLEAGVRPETADMYLDEFELPVAFEYRRIEGHVGQDMAFPAWSLSKLIGMIPDQVECEGYNYYLFMLPRDKEFTIKYSAETKKKPKVTGQWACVFSRTREIGQGGE